MDRESFQRIRAVGASSWFHFLTERWDYDSNGRMLYHGIAPAGSATSDADWVIWKYGYDSAGRLNYVQVCSYNYPTAFGVIWDNRASTVTYLT